MKTAGIVLAAGKGSRMGGFKLGTELLPGMPLGSFALLAAMSSRLDPIIVVVREGDSLSWLPEIGAAGAGPAGSRVRIAVCPDADEGMSRSIRCGLDVISRDGGFPAAAMILLGDQPLVTSTWIDRLIAAFEADPALDYVASGDGRNVMPPMLLSRTLYPRLRTLEGDKGAREVLSSREVRGIVLQAGEASRLWDADTKEDLIKIRQYLKYM